MKSILVPQKTLQRVADCTPLAHQRSCRIMQLVNREVIVVLQQLLHVALRQCPHAEDTQELNPRVLYKEDIGMSFEEDVAGVAHAIEKPVSRARATK